MSLEKLINRVFSFKILKGVKHLIVNMNMIILKQEFKSRANTKYFKKNI